MRRLQLIDRAENKADVGIPNGLRIAFATTDKHRVDAHFGSAPAIMIYEVGTQAYRFLEAIEFDVVSEENGEHGSESEDRIGAKVAAISGCAMLFVHAIGGGAAARVVNGRVYPIKVAVPEAITSIIERVQTMLRGTPPPWLRKLMSKKTSSDFDFAED